MGCHPHMLSGKKNAIVALKKYIYIFQEYEETCLFIIARFSASESLRVYINILKIPPPFANSDGYPASGIRYESVAREFSEPLPHSYSLATARRRVHFSSRFLISLFAFYSYISSYSYAYFTAVFAWMLTDYYASLDFHGLAYLA